MCRPNTGPQNKMSGKTLIKTWNGLHCVKPNVLNEVAYVSTFISGTNNQYFYIGIRINKEVYTAATQGPIRRK